jgi:hypothetical protein
MLPAYADDTLQKVKDALEVWADYMRHDNSTSGYRKKSSGFHIGGGIDNWEDLEYSVDINQARAVEAILEGCTVSQRLSVHHYHLNAVWTSRRTNILDDYAEALMAVELGLKKRGLL